ncbi:hypothetical protein BYT27DRAFT_7210607, partial [Phlegmacium glaucopus]
MDDRLIHNPHLEAMPDHAGPHYNVLRDALTQNGMTLKQAVQALNNSWTLNHNARIQVWDQQVIDDAAAEEAQRLQQLANKPQVIQELPEREEERVEMEKKRPKMKDFDDVTSIGNYIAPRPAQYALHWIEDFEYIELWYLTPEGCTDATQLQLTQSDDAFGLTKVDDMVTLKSVSSLKASKNWSEKAINAFAQLFTQLELHPYRQREFEWHDQLKLGSAFNIGILNEDLLQSIYKELLDKVLHSVTFRHTLLRSDSVGVVSG